MRRYLIIPLILMYTFAVWCVAFWGRVLPGTTLGNGVDISRMNREELHQKLDMILAADAVNLRLPNRDEQVSLTGLGLTADQGEIDKKLFSTSKGAEIVRLARGIVTVTKTKNIPVTLVSGMDAVTFPIADPAASKIIYNTASGAFTFDPPLFDYVLSAADIVREIDSQFGAGTIEINVTARRVAHNDKTIGDLNARLANASGSEVLVRVRDGKDYSNIALTPREIRQMLAFTTRGDTPSLNIDRTVFATTILSKLTDRQKADFQLDEAYPNTIALLNHRFEFDNVTPVVLGIDDGPSTDGTLADRYIEVDISQQKMYFFLNGSVYRQFRVSTGYDYPTPPGNFHILNKAPKAFSGIYNVWMEYWMGFSYANDIGAYLGIHEIAYGVDDKGKHVYRLGNYIGEPKTGGCIALRPGESKEIYDLSYPGMLVKIVK